MLENETSSTISLQGNGVYQVTAISNLCNSTSNDVIYQDGDLVVVGINDNAKFNSTESIEIYPNPNEGLFNIKITNNNFGKITLKMTDVSGKIIMIDELIKSKSNLNHVIDITQFDKGIYFVELISTNGKVIKQIVKY